MVISDKEIVERRHKEVLEEVKMKMSEEHAVNVEQITRVFEQKILVRFCCTWVLFQVLCFSGVNHH